MSEDKLKEKAIAELLKETKRAAARAEVSAPIYDIFYGDN